MTPSFCVAALGFTMLRAPAPSCAARIGCAVAMAAADAPPLLVVSGLRATVADTPILKGVDLIVRRGEVHAIMGPNGSGKSTLSKVLVGHPSYEVTGGCARYRNDEDLLELEPEERAQQGIFLAFQYPVEIPGVSNNDFLRLAVNKRRGALGLDEYDPLEFLGVLSEKMEMVSMSPDFLGRDVNSGFSGGEKKRNEILQMALLEPELAILDETDSGLDIDALKTVAAGVNACRSEKNAMILITHYQRLLDYVKPDFVHIMYQGRIVRSGGPELALELEAEGYAFLGITKEQQPALS
jgi:Fe-S cluster assembly ATP-binding protein